MPKIAKALTAVEIKRLTEPGLHTVGTVAGLRLRVKESGARSWVLRTMLGARRAEIGLGGYPLRVPKREWICVQRGGQAKSPRSGLCSHERTKEAKWILNYHYPVRKCCK